MRVGIFVADSNGGYPVPASKGGAVQTLIEHLVDENNKKQLFQMEIVSFYDKEAECVSKNYPNIRFHWIRVPRIIQWADRVLFWIVHNLFRRKKTLSFKSVFSLFYYVLKATKLLKKRKFHKVVLENNIPLAWCIKLSNYQGDYYYHLHNIPRINAKCKEVFAGCKKILCVSQYVADQICMSENPIGPVAKEKIGVLYNCIDNEKFCPNKDRTARNRSREGYHIKPNEKVIIYTGRLSAEKGADKLLQAASMLSYSDLKIIIVGSYLYNSNMIDKYQKVLYALAQQEREKIIFTGYIAQDKLPDLYRMADLAVLPSVWDEPGGLTIVEAMACAIPVITTNSGGIPEYVGNCGKIVSKDDNLIEQLAKNISELFETPEMMENYAVKEAQRVQECFCKTQYLEKFNNFLNE